MGRLRSKLRRKFHINRNNKKFLGVCSGIADYLDVPAWIIRVVFIGAFLMGGWFMVPAYFVCYFFMDNKSGEFKDKVTSSSAFKHFQNVDYKKTLYRNPHDAKFLGICAGVADYLEVDVNIVRIVTFISFFVAGPIPWIAYFAAYFVLDTQVLLLPPRVESTVGATASKGEARQEQQQEKSEDTQQARFKDRKYSKRREFQYCARKFSILHERLVRMEAFVTSKQFKLHQQFKDLS